MIKIKIGKSLNVAVSKKEVKVMESRQKVAAEIDFDIKIKKSKNGGEKDDKESDDHVVLVDKVYTQDHYSEWHKNKDKNLFEEIIDKMMVESFMDETFKPYIDEVREIIGKKLPKDKKRFAILCTLDKNRNLLRKAKVYNTTSITKMEHIKDYIKILRDYVKVSEVEKKKFGEVMTPIDLVKEMLNKLPREVWSNPDLKWLDPCNGVGPFGALVVAGLMKGLDEWEPDEEKRYKHIVENMVYVCELQPKNMFLWMCMMDPKDEYYMNVYCGSFLDAGFDKHMREVWGVEKFDVVVGNPPYQERKEGNKKTQPLWHFFVKNSLDILIENGYLCMVHPSGWRNVDGVFKDTQILLKSKKMLSLKLHSFGQGQEMFDAAINFDFYCLKNENSADTTTTITTVSGDIENLNISKLEFISDENISKIQSLVAKDDEEKVNLIWDSTYHTQKEHIIKEPNEEYKFPVIYTVKSPDKGNTPTFWYSNHNKKHFGIPKVVWANGASGVFIDENGEYGLTQFAYAIIDEISNLENIKKAMMNEKFIKDVMGFKKSLGDKYNRKIIATFRKDFWKEFI